MLKITLESITLSFCECDLIEGVVVLGLEVVEGCLLAGDFCLSSRKVVFSFIEVGLNLLVAGIGIINRRVVVDDDGVGLEWIAVAISYLRSVISRNFCAVKVEGDGLTCKDLSRWIEADKNALHC